MKGAKPRPASHGRRVVPVDEARVQHVLVGHDGEGRQQGRRQPRRRRAGRTRPPGASVASGTRSSMPAFTARRGRYFEGFSFQVAIASAEPWLRTPLSLRMASVAATIASQGNTRISESFSTNSMARNSIRRSREPQGDHVGQVADGTCR